MSSSSTTTSATSTSDSTSSATTTNTTQGSQAPAQPTEVTNHHQPLTSTGHVPNAPSPVANAANVNIKTSTTPPQQTAPPMNGAVKGPKPRPLKIPSQSNMAPQPMPYGVHHPHYGPPASAPVAHHQPHDIMSTEELLDLMENINRSVKASHFTPTLAGQIFRLYNQLKISGETLEQTHRNELNRVFVSLRQACCRDSGQLGTPCRLKMMELVELRAMGWRPNLAHSQYYLTRSQHHPNGFSNEFSQTGDSMSGGELEQLGATPVSAPPYGNMPMNPFAFNMPAAPMPSAADLINVGQPMVNPAPSYYLIPATMGHPHPQIAFMTQSSNGTAILGPPPQPMHNPLTGTFSTPAILNPMNMPNGSPPMMFQKGPATKPTAKIPGKGQFRDEVVIRNADSGKIMGVKGRRVALIEEISKTVISFQKVPQGAKERTLTVTGSSEESILQAKILIEDTIRRNVSPMRGDGHDSGELLTHADADILSEEAEGKENGANGADGSSATEQAMAELGSILKMTCTDPAVLNAARQALNEYFQRHEPLRRSVTDGAVKHANKERRKSMPLPLNALANVVEVAEPECQTPKTVEDLNKEDNAYPNLSLKQKLSAISTPNLAAGDRRNVLRAQTSSTRSAGKDDGNEADDFNDDNSSICRVVYTRDFLLACAGNTNAKNTPPALATISENIGEIVPTGREPFDPVAYKQKCAEMKQGRV